MNYDKATMKGRGPKALMLVVVLLIMSFTFICANDSDVSDATEPTITLTASSSKTTPNGSNITITATISKGDAVEEMSIKWSSSSASVADVENHNEIPLGSDATSATMNVEPGSTAGETTITAVLKVGNTQKTSTCKVYVQRDVSSVKITDNGTDIPNNKLVLHPNETKTVTGTTSPANATVKAWSWDSSVKTVATVDNTGKITVVGVGTTVITATASQYYGASKSGELTVEVKNIDVESVSLDKTTDTLKVNEEKILIATILPANATIKTVTATSNHPEFATATVMTTPPSGLQPNQVAIKIKGIADSGTGTATITVTTTDKAKTATCAVKVERVPVTGVTLTETTLEMEKDDTHRLTAVVAPNNATNKEVTWSSSNTSVATIDSSGNITPVSPGDTTITVTTKEGDFTATCTVTVTKDITIAPNVTKSSGVATVDNVSSVKEQIEKVKTDGYHPILYVSATDCDKIVVSSDLIKSLRSASKATLFLETRTGSFQVSDGSLKLLKVDKSTIAVSMKTTTLGEKYDSYKPFYAYEVNIFSGDDKVSTSFGGGRAIIILPHNLATGESADKLDVAYIPNDGKPVLVEKSEYDSKNKEIIFLTNHCSTFMVLFHDNDIKPEGDGFIVFIVFMIIVIVLIVLITLYIRSANGFKGMFAVNGNNRRQQPPQPPAGYYPPAVEYNNYYNYRR